MLTTSLGKSALLRLLANEVLGEYFDLSLLGHGKQPVELK
jgi:hypothetical protein